MGKPVTLTFAATHPVEHPGGLQAVANIGSGGVVALFNRVAVHPTATPSPTAVTWRDPAIFTQIAAAGQTVVSVDVFTVYGNQNWQNSGITTVPGQLTWMDTQAVGTWTGVGVGGTTYTTDANGAISGAMKNGGLVRRINPLSEWMTLIGHVGTPPPVTPNQPVYGDPNMFGVGNTLTNYQLPGSGTLNFMINNNYAGPPHTQGTGAQIVRIIVTR